VDDAVAVGGVVEGAAVADAVAAFVESVVSGGRATTAIAVGAAAANAVGKAGFAAATASAAGARAAALRPGAAPAPAMPMRGAGRPVTAQATASPWPNDADRSPGRAVATAKRDAVDGSGRAGPVEGRGVSGPASRVNAVRTDPGRPLRDAAALASTGADARSRQVGRAAGAPARAVAGNAEGDALAFAPLARVLLFVTAAAAGAAGALAISSGVASVGVDPAAALVGGAARDLVVASEVEGVGVAGMEVEGMEGEGIDVGAAAR
jgi:hypothetical protein